MTTRVGMQSLAIGAAVLYGAGLLAGCSSESDAPAAAPTTRPAASTPVATAPAEAATGEELLTCEEYGKTHDSTHAGDISRDKEAGTVTVWDEHGTYLLRLDDSECRAAYPAVEKLAADAERSFAERP